MNKTYADHDEIIAELNAPSMGDTYFPEAETMETRRGKGTNDFLWGAFLTFAVAAITFMFFGNWIISQVMN